MNKIYHEVWFSRPADGNSEKQMVMSIVQGKITAPPLYV